MSSENKNNGKELEESVRIKSERKIRLRKKDRKGLLYGLGMFGLVGWSVAIPALMMLALGIWIDRTYQSPYSWTLMLLVLGIVIGCVNAWYWVNRESSGG